MLYGEIDDRNGMIRVKENELGGTCGALLAYLYSNCTLQIPDDGDDG